MTSFNCQPYLWLVFLATIYTCMAYQNTNTNTILQQQINVPLTHTINQATEQQKHQQRHEKDETVENLAVENPKVAALTIPTVNIVKQKVPLPYNNATIELVPPSIITQANNHIGSAAAVVNSQFLQTPATAFYSNYNNQQNVRQLLRNIDERLKNMRNVEMRVAKIQVSFCEMYC